MQKLQEVKSQKPQKVQSVQEVKSQKPHQVHELNSQKPQQISNNTPIKKLQKISDNKNNKNNKTQNNSTNFYGYTPNHDSDSDDIDRKVAFRNRSIDLLSVSQQSDKIASPESPAPSESPTPLILTSIVHIPPSDPDTPQKLEDQVPERDIAETNERIRVSNNKKVAIAFSGGNDSSACVPILPETSIIVYLKRVWNSPKNLVRHTQQLKCLEHVKKYWQRRAYVIETNIELITQHSIGRVGFSTDYVPCIPSILLSNHCNVGYICTGTIGLYLKGGVKANDFINTDYYRFWYGLFRTFGLTLFWPVGGCSDRVTETICYRANIPSQPCLRSDAGPCNKCFKCFRKNAVIQADRMELSKIAQNVDKNVENDHINSNNHNNNTPIDINKEIYAKLQKKPITRITCKKLGWIKDPDIKAHHLKMDFSFENGYHPELTRKLVPPELQEVVINGLNKWSRPMTREEMNIVRDLDLSSLVATKSIDTQ